MSHQLDGGGSSLQLQTAPTGSSTASKSESVSDGRGARDQERKIRREIANSNERRRMQSINAGFQSLHTLLPRHEGEKLSKAAILQQTAEYIYSLEQEKTRLLSQNCTLKRLLSLSQQNNETSDESGPSFKRKKAKNEQDKNEEAVSSQEPVTAPAPAPITNIDQQQKVEVQVTSPTLLPSNNTVLSINEASETQQLNSSIVIEEAANPHSTVTIQRQVNCMPGEDGSPKCVVKSDATSKSNGRSYIVTSNSTHNLDSIVEAIKHLEGDQLFTTSATPHGAIMNTVSTSAEKVNETTTKLPSQEILEYTVKPNILASSPAVTAAVPQSSVADVLSTKTSGKSIIIFRKCP